MRTFAYWWKTIIWHPLDIADRILVLVGAVSGYLYKGDNPMTYDLAWQIPLGMIVVLLIWRLMQIPVKIMEDMRRANRGEYSLTLEEVGQRIDKIENTVEGLQEKVDPKLNLEDIKKKIFWKFVGLDDSNIGGIARSINFVFEIVNASSVWINTTGNTRGFLTILSWKLLGANWQVLCDGIAADSKGTVLIICSVSENFAKTLAFKPQTGYFPADFSGMFIEIETKDSQREYTLGYIPIDVKCDIPIKDHTAFQTIRNIVKWEDTLGMDERISK